MAIDIAREPAGEMLSLLETSIERFEQTKINRDSHPGWVAQLSNLAGVDLDELMKIALGYPDASDSESLAMLAARVRKARKELGCASCSAERCRGPLQPSGPPIRQLIRQT